MDIMTKTTTHPEQQAEKFRFILNLTKTLCADTDVQAVRDVYVHKLAAFMMRP